MIVEAIRHKDVKGKETLYLKLSNVMGNDHYINVGEKTITRFEELEKQELELLESEKKWNADVPRETENKKQK